MKVEKYTVLSDSSHVDYEFLSEGPKGTIKKVVTYEKIEKNIYNLVFGDWDEVEQKLNDKIRSNNNDRDKVLNTVASTVIDFMKYHKDALIVAKGFTSSRTRLYQIGIATNLDEINKIFEIRGFGEEGWQIFEKGTHYSAFALKAK